MDRTWERKEEELFTGCISFTIKYPRSAHKLLTTTYLSIICNRHTNLDAVSPVDVHNKWRPWNDGLSP